MVFQPIRCIPHTEHKYCKSLSTGNLGGLLGQVADVVGIASPNESQGCSTFPPPLDGLEVFECLWKLNDRGPEPMKLSCQKSFMLETQLLPPGIPWQGQIALLGEVLMWNRVRSTRIVLVPEIDK